MDDYDTAEVSRLFFNFIEDLSTWYIKNSRTRFKSEKMNEKSSAMNTLSYILYSLSKLLAPLTPFIAEIIYQELGKKGIAKLKSVHLEFLPEFEVELVDMEVLIIMDQTREVVKKSLEVRDKSKIPVRQVLNELKVKGISIENDYLDIIAEAINVKKVTTQTSDESEILVELDTEITPELKLEGIARNLIRNLNNYRKKLNLSTKNRIDLYIETCDTIILEALENYEEKIKKMIQADTIVKNLKGKQDLKKFKIDNNVVEVYIEVKN
jgi:isoleucyl-tRNA synthetase